jgi:hypothetical protein
VLLHQERGFTISGRLDSAELLTRSVLNVVLPDDDASGEEHPWPWLAERARARGLDATAEELRRLPYEVVLTERVAEWLEMPA